MQSLSIFRGRSVGVFAGVLACGAAASIASATTVSASDPFITVHASSGAFSGTITVPLGDVVTVSDPDMDLWFWATTAPVQIFDGPNLVASLVDMTVLAGRNTLPDGEQRFAIDINFNVQAGTGDTTFELISPTLSFAPLTNARGLVSAGIVGSDQQGSLPGNPGITITPAASNGFGFNALFNGNSVFRSYFGSPLSNLPSGSVGEAGNMVPEGVFQPMGTVSDMTSIYRFSVTAGDTAGGTTTYAVAPAPGTLAVVGLSGLVMARRRRR